jgi:hypothetical protein
MATKTWIGPNNGDWSTASNWSPHGAPGPSDSVSLPLANTVNVGAPVAIASSSAAAGATLNLGANSLSTTGALVFTGATLNTAGAVTVGTSASFTGGSVNTYAGSSLTTTNNLTFNGTVLTENGGTQAHPGGSISAGGSLFVEGGAVAKVGYYASLQAHGALIFNGASLDNFGTVATTGTGNLAFEGNSAVTIEAGAALNASSQLVFNGSTLSNAGSVTAGTNASFVGGSVNTYAGSSLTTTNNLTFNGTALTENGGTQAHPGGSISAGGDLLVEGGAVAKVGDYASLQANGWLIVNASSLDNFGAVATTGTGNLAFENNAAATIEAGATLSASSGLVFSSSTLSNAGSVTAGTNASFIDGSVNTYAGSSLSATDNVTFNGTVLTENGGTQAHPGGSISAGGNVALEGGAVAKVGDYASLQASGALIVNGSSLDNFGAVSAAGNASFVGGSLTAEAGSTLTAGSALSLNNTTVTDAGSITAGSVALGNGSIFNLDGVKLTAGGVSLASGTKLVATGASEITGAVTGAGTLEVDSGTLTLDAKDGANIVLNGGVIADSSGIALAGHTLTGDGTITTGGAAATDLEGGTVTAANGTLTFTANVDQTAATNFNIGTGATLAFDGSVGTGANSPIDPSISFAGSNATLDLTGEGANEQSAFRGVIKNFDQGANQHDAILVKGSGVAGDKAVYDSNTHTLSIETSGGTVLDTLIVGSGSPTAYKVTENGNVDTVRAATDPICFYPGTLVRTPDGEVAVESLKPGDLVTTADGRAVAVNWVGRQTISMRFADPLRVLPIRIRAGALDENAPARDLLVSPDHALLIEGALIHAGALVNGTSILRETRVPAVFTYYHVETDDHSLILAENAPAETFVDSVDRLNFDNWSEFEALYPDGKVVEELPYPRAKSHRQVPVRVRVKLAERALAAGVAQQGAA